MNRPTADRLSAINRRFYRDFAAEFDATRDAPWPGWERVLRPVERTRQICILDVGCGNGRFGRFAERRLGRSIRYFGVDSSPELLRAASRDAGRQWSLLEGDALDGEWPAEVASRSFDLVACFGLMHHIPGEANRRAVAERTAERVGEGGWLAVSFWQFGADERFDGRIVSWDEAAPGLDEEELEPGDRLLRWGQAPQGDREPRPVRYCHHCPPEEADRLTRGLGLELGDRYLSDGRTDDLNLYHLLTRR